MLPVLSFCNSFFKQMFYNQNELNATVDKCGNTHLATTYYNHDAMGRITSVAVSGNTASYTYDTYGQLTGENNQALDKIFQYEYNEVGNTVYLDDAWGNCTIKGTTTNYVVAHANPIRYRGYYYDENTKLYYLNSRYYNPEWRRFISPDDANYLDPENVNGLNLYCYCNNDPVNFVDPSGHSVVALLIGGFILGAATGAAISFTTQMIENDFNINKVNPWLIISDAMFGGVNGLLAVSGAGTLTSAFLGTVLNNLQLAATSAISGEEITNFDILSATILGVAGAFISKAGINAKQVSGKWSTFAGHINNAISYQRKLMYTAKRAALKKDVIISGVNYIASNIGTSVVANFMDKNKERYYYGY